MRPILLCALLLLSCSKPQEQLQPFPALPSAKTATTSQASAPKRKPSVWDYQLARYSTKYKYLGEYESRALNIELASAKLNGVVLKPGDEFSFNEIVGIRSEAAGFQTAPVIFMGLLADDTGGGVCQVSSTLHAALLSTGLKPTRRFAHSRPSSYIPIGLDATVTFPASCETDPNCSKMDFQFTNTLSTDLGIRTFYVKTDTSDEKELVIAFYAQEPSKLKVEFKSFYKWTDAAYRVRYRRTNKYRNAHKKRIQKGKNGRVGHLTITTKKEEVDGSWHVIDVQGYTSTYAPVDEIWEVGLAYQLPEVPWESSSSPLNSKNPSEAAESTLKTPTTGTAQGQESNPRERGTVTSSSQAPSE